MPTFDRWLAEPIRMVEPVGTELSEYTVSSATDDELSENTVSSATIDELSEYTVSSATIDDPPHYTCNHQLQLTNLPIVIITRIKNTTKIVVVALARIGIITLPREEEWQI